MKKILTLALVFVISAIWSYPLMTRAEMVKETAEKKNDIYTPQKGDVTWTGTQGPTFDKSANGYGWYQGYNRKVQTNFDPGTGHMIGSVYRQLALSGSGTIGGTVGSWADETFSGIPQTLYSESPFQGGEIGDPGGRYPYICEFINGYVFAIFNDYDLTTDGEESHAMFVVGDATWGWDDVLWSEPKRIEASEGGATPPGAWSGLGDVAYNPDDGYYYWTVNWDDWTEIAGQAPGYVPERRKIYIMTGRTKTPVDADSWEWTDYQDYDLDTGSLSPQGINEMAGNLQVAYSKDIYGYGNGNAVIIGMYKDETFYMEDEAGEPVDLQYFMRLGYMHTNNWGADDSTGDFKGNWMTLNNEGINLKPSDIDKLFPWYGKQYADTDSTTVPLNMSYFQWNTSAIATENDIVHVLLRNMPASTETEFIYFADGDDYVAGYYDVVGKITDTGIDWIRATHIASWMGIDDGLDEWKYSNTHDMGIGYAGNGTVYATWIDRPYTRFVENPFTEGGDPNKTYVCDAYFTYSPDDGRTWDIDITDSFLADSTLVSEDPEEWEYIYWDLNYAKNITKTTEHDEGFQVATHGYNADGEMTVFAATQYYDPENPLPDPVNDFYDHQQFLKFYKITGAGTGIEAEEISLTKDFDLHQNYPNPFNPSTEIKFNLANSSEVKLTVFNAKGESVMNLKDEEMSKGLHTVNFDGSSLNSGVYFYKLEANGRSETKKMVLMK